MYQLFYNAYKVRENRNKRSINFRLIPITEKNKLGMEYMTQSIKKYIKKIENIYSDDALNIKSKINSQIKKKINDDLSLSRKPIINSPAVFILGILFFNSFHLFKHLLRNLDSS